MSITVADNKEVLPWGIEIELVKGRCIYMGATHVIANKDEIKIVVNDMNSITLPKTSVRKIMMMGTPSEQDKP